MRCVQQYFCGHRIHYHQFDWIIFFEWVFLMNIFPFLACCLLTLHQKSHAIALCKRETGINMYSDMKSKILSLILINDFMENRSFLVTVEYDITVLFFECHFLMAFSSSRHSIRWFMICKCTFLRTINGSVIFHVRIQMHLCKRKVKINNGKWLPSNDKFNVHVIKSRTNVLRTSFAYWLMWARVSWI